MWSCQLTLRSIIRKTVKYIDQSDQISRRVVRFDANLSVENMTPDSLCKMLLEVCVSQKIKLKKDNKHLILIMLNLSVDNNDLFLVHDFFIVIGVLFVVCLFVCLFIFFAVVVFFLFVFFFFV